MRRATVLGTIVALGLVPLGAAAQHEASPATIRVRGEATLEVAPDQAVIDIAVVTESEDADRAARSNAEKVESVLAALRRALGSGASKRLRTLSYSLTPRYTAYQQGQASRIDGYVATNVVQVQSEDLEGVGKLIDLALASGANRIQQMRFVLKDEQPVRAQALREATVRAKARADAIAEALGLEVVRVVSVEQGGASGPVPVLHRPQMMRAQGAETASQVLPGNIELSEFVLYSVEVRQ